MILACILRPCAAGAVRRHLEAEVCIRDHVNPGRGRSLALLEHRDILPPGRGEASQAVEVLEDRHGRGRIGARDRRAIFQLNSRRRLWLPQTRQLVAQGAASRDEYSARRRLQQIDAGCGHQVPAKRENGATARAVFVATARLRGPDRGIDRELQM